MPAPKLKSLHSAMVATLSGYKEALDKGDDAAMSALCRDMIELRSAHHREIHPMLEKAGESVVDGETVMSKIQETVIDVRAAITGIDKDTLPSFIRGETSIVDEYNDAIDEAEAGRVSSISSACCCRRALRLNNHHCCEKGTAAVVCCAIATQLRPEAQGAGT